MPLSNKRTKAKDETEPPLKIIDLEKIWFLRDIIESSTRTRNRYHEDDYQKINIVREFWDEELKFDMLISIGKDKKVFWRADLFYIPPQNNSSSSFAFEIILANASGEDNHIKLVSSTASDTESTNNRRIPACQIIIAFVFDELIRLHFKTFQLDMRGGIGACICYTRAGFANNLMVTRTRAFWDPRVEKIANTSDCNSPTLTKNDFEMFFKLLPRKK